MQLIAGLLIICALLGLCGPRGLACAVLILGTLFGAAVAGHVGQRVNF